MHKTESEIRIFDDTTATAYELFMKIPVTLDDTWIPNIDEPSITRTVLSLSESLAVPAGPFTDCANLRDSDSEDPEFFFGLLLARGTGVIRYMINNTSESGICYMVYHLTDSITDCS